MTWHIVASNGKESRVVSFGVPLAGTSATFTEFETEDRADVHAAVLAAGNPGWEFTVTKHIKQLKSEPDAQ